MFGLSVDIGIDLGTANVIVFVKGKGIVLREPSVVAIDRDDNNSILAVGEEARRMLGRTPGNIMAIRPLKDGVIANYDMTAEMMKYFIGKVAGRSWFFRPRVMVCVPAGVNQVQQRAVIEATLQAGARKAYLIEEPIAAAIGAGVSIGDPYGSMVIDIGGGTADVAVLSLGSMVVGESLSSAGGDKFDEAILRFVRKEYNLMIGERTAEEVKKDIGCAIAGEYTDEKEVRGIDLMSGLPQTRMISSDKTVQAFGECLESLVHGVKGVLERTPPELAADIYDRGIVLTGGGSLLRGLDKLIERETGINTYLAENPLDCVALGTGKALVNLDKIPDGLVMMRKVNVK